MNDEKDCERFTWKIFNNEAQQATAQASCNIPVATNFDF